MQFILTGFTQQLGFRVFGFEGKRDKGDEGPKVAYTVKADLGLLRLHGIRVQELPLLCRGMLERIMLEPSIENEAQHAWTFSEAEMSLHEKDCVAVRVAAAAKKRLTRRPPVTNPGSGWRAPQPALET